MTTVVVGVDRSKESAEALRWAFREAQLRGATLEVVLAWGSLDRYRGRDRFEPFYDAADASQSLDAFVAETLPEADHGVVKITAVEGSAADALVAASIRADLLAVGPRGTGGFLGLRLGSVTERCLTETLGPVAVVRAWPERPAGEVERVVVAVDGSESSHDAVRWAVDECARRRSRLAVVCAWLDPAPAGPYSSGAIDAGVFEAAAWRTIERALDLDGLDLSVLPEPPERVAIHGSAGAAIVEAAEGADLLVVGSRGLGRFHRVLLGSVAAHVARRAPTPVVIVRRLQQPD
jgi:nucleotide-binding universal stress UspA family protein